MSAAHPDFCVGGMACEGGARSRRLGALRHETGFYVLAKRITLQLVRPESQSCGEEYERSEVEVEVEVELTLTHTDGCDEDGNEVTSSVERPHRDFERLMGFLEEYRDEQRRYTENPSWAE